MTHDDCAANLELLSLRLAWPHRSDEDRLSLFITDCDRAERVLS